MNFKIKNNNIFFRDYDLTEHMEVKEVHGEKNENGDMEYFVVAGFKAVVDLDARKSFLACMLDEMDDNNLADLKSEIEGRLNEI